MINLKKKIIYSVITFIFFIWIMPLGAYVKPAFEQIVCNGKRPICMCTHTKAENKSNNKILKAASLLPDAYGAPSGGSEFTFALFRSNALNNNWQYHCQIALDYEFLFTHHIDHIPKV